MADANAKLIAELDALDREDKFEEIYEKLVRPDGNYKGMDLELMWRLAKAIRFLVLTKGRKDKKAKAEWIQLGLLVMKTAVEEYPDQCLSNTWYGIMLNVQSTEEGIKNKIKLGYEIRDYFDKGYKANKHDFHTLHALGCWCFEVSSLSKIERAFATTFFGKPPESSFEDALGFYLEADKVEPGHAYTVCRIAQCYDRLGRKQEAKDWAMKAIKLHAKDTEIEEFQKDCRRIAS
ncbi:hypothetical protein Aperf_G00000041466 [Anoplocephala perfoliata]